MKRILITLLVMLALALATIPAGSVGEHWNQFATFSYAGASTTYATPIFLGASFRGKKIAIQGVFSSGTGAVTITIYSPLSAGPATATDSTTIAGYFGTLAATVIYHYIDISDTVLVITPANIAARVTVYGN